MKVKKVVIPKFRILKLLFLPSTLYDSRWSQTLLNTPFRKSPLTKTSNASQIRAACRIKFGVLNSCNTWYILEITIKYVRTAEIYFDFIRLNVQEMKKNKSIGWNWRNTHYHKFSKRSSFSFSSPSHDCKFSFFLWLVSGVHRFW